MTEKEDNKKDYTCETCGYSCFRPETLKRHKYTVHEGHKDHQCIFCLESFTQSWTLRRHVNTFHKDSAALPKNPEKVILNKMVNNGCSEIIEESVASLNVPGKHLTNISEDNKDQKNSSQCNNLFNNIVTNKP